MPTCDYCGENVADPCRSMDQVGKTGCPAFEEQLMATANAGQDKRILPTARRDCIPVMQYASNAPKKDAVNQPQHYARWKMQPIEFTAINDLPWWLFSVIKYIMRYDAKNGLEDLYKARSFLDMKIRQLEGHQRFWEKPVATERALNGK